MLSLNKWGWEAKTDKREKKETLYLHCAPFLSPEMKFFFPFVTCCRLPVTRTLCIFCDIGTAICDPGNTRLGHSESLQTFCPLGSSTPIILGVCSPPGLSRRQEPLWGRGLILGICWRKHFSVM